MYQKILVALEGSTQDEAVLEHARKLASCDCTEVALLIVIEHSPITVSRESVNLNPESPGFQVDAVAEWEETEDYLRALKENMAADKFAISTGIIEGPASASILQFARMQNADLILLATHKSEEPQNTPLGCVAEGVLCRARVPVMFVPTRQFEIPLRRQSKLFTGRN